MSPYATFLFGIMAIYALAFLITCTTSKRLRCLWRRYWRAVRKPLTIAERNELTII